MIQGVDELSIHRVLLDFDPSTGRFIIIILLFRVLFIRNVNPGLITPWLINRGVLFPF